MSGLLREYFTVLVFGAAAVAMVGAMLGAGSLLRPKRAQAQKYISYESGVDPVGTGWAQSQIRYYLFGLLFVLFEVETVFIFPWAVRIDDLGVFGLVEMAVFILTVFIAYAYVWRRGGLEWE